MESLKKIAINMMKHEEQHCNQEELQEEYCEKCNTRKSVVVVLFGKKRKMPCLCECEKQEVKKQELIMQNKEKQMQLERLKINSLMDKKFEQCTFLNWEKDKANIKMYELGINYTKNWERMKKDNIGFILYGSVGIGKTYLVSCIANKLLEQYVPVIITSSIALLARYKKLYLDKQAENIITNNLQAADLLIIDDLGAENDTNWVKEKIYEVVDNRYRNSKPTIITTNLTLEQLQQKLTGEDGITRTYDRLLEMCYPIKLEGKSRRLNAYKNKEETINKLLLNR